MKCAIRRATLKDIAALVELAAESVANDPLPVKVDREAMRETLQTLMNPAHFLWVSELDGKVVAGVAGDVGKSFWFRGLQCSVLLYYSRVPGAGLPLLRELARWVKSRRGIKVCVMELEPNADPRLAKAMKRLGFTRSSSNISYVRTP